MKIAIGSDHAGYQLKEYIKKNLPEGIEYTDYGTNSAERADYPDFAHPVAEKVEQGECDLGILICGSGNGIAMAANKHEGIRAAVCWNEEISSLARQHNDANIICLPARFVDSDLAVKLIKLFLETSFEGGRHEGRVNKIPC